MTLITKVLNSVSYCYYKANLPLTYLTILNIYFQKLK